MSFSFAAQARSKSHALQLLEKSSLPAPVRQFIETAVRNIGPQSGHELRAIQIEATGHLAEDSSSYSQSSGSLKVLPIFVPD